MTTPGVGVDRNVQVQLNADVDPFQRGMREANKSVATLTDGVVKLAKKIDELWKNAGKKLELFGAGGLVALAAATEAANRLDVAFRGVRATAALTNQSVNELKNNANQLARSLPVATSSVAQLMGQVQDLGVRGTRDITRFTEVAVRLGAATNTAPGELFTSLVQLTKSMNGSIQDIDRYSSALVALSKQNGVAAAQVVGFSNAIEAVAQRAGYTETQVLGLATAFSKAGADSGPGANAFIKITNDISEAVRTGSRDLDMYATIAGRSREEFAKMAQGNPASAFIEVIEAIKDAGPRGIAILQQLGLDGVRTQRAIASLTSGQANLTQAMEQSQAAYEKNNALNKASNAAYDDLSSAMMKFRTAITQITQSMGGPFLGVATKFFEAITKILNLFNALPGPVKSGIAIFAALGSSMTMLGGFVVLASLALLKFGAAWRLLSGAIGTNIFKGMFDGLRGKPRELEDTSSAMTKLYNNTYRLTDALRGARKEGEGPGFLANITGAQGGNILGFPGRVARSNVTETVDTLKHPLDYRKRKEEAYSQYSMAGMSVRAKNFIQENETLRPMRDALFGSDEERMTEAQRTNLRLRQIADERTQVYKESYAKLKKVMRENPDDFDNLAALYLNPKGKKGGATPDNVSDKQRKVFIQNTAMDQANAAADALKARFKEEDGEAAINPFKTLALKIKTLSSEMVADIGVGTGKIMDLVVAAFGQSVAKITELAAKAKIALIEVQGGAPGSGTSGLASAVQSLGGAAASAGNMVASGVASMATATGKRGGPSASLSDKILGGLGALGPMGAGNRVITLTQQDMASKEDKIEAAAAAAEDLGGSLAGVSEKAGGLGEMMSGLGGKLGTAAGAVARFAGPMALLAPLVMAGVSAFKNWANSSQKAVEGLGELGQQFKDFKLPSVYTGDDDKRAPVDNKKSDIDLAYAKATSGAFLNDKKNANEIERFNMLKTEKAKEALARVTAQRMVESAAFQGRPVSDDDRETYTSQMMNVFGKEKGYKIAQQNLKNRGGSNTINTLDILDEISKQGDAKARQVLFQGLGANATQTDASGLPVYAAANLLAVQARNPNAVKANFIPGVNNVNVTKNEAGFAEWSGLVGAMNSAFEKQMGTKAPKGTDFYYGQTPQDYLDAFLKDSNPKVQRWGKDLQKVFTDIGYTGDNASIALQRLNVILAETAAKSEDLSPTAVFNRTMFGQVMGSNFDFSNLQTNKAQMGLLAGGLRLGGENAFGSADFYNSQLSALLEARDTQAVQGDPNRLAIINSQIAGARSGIGGQRSLTMSGIEQMAAVAGDISALSQRGSMENTFAELQDLSGQLSSLYNSQMEALKGYVLQVRQMNRQREYAEQDHNLQLKRMYRDRRLQQQEAMRGFREQIRSSMYEVAQSFGNPGAFVQSSYTQSATSAFTGLMNQNNYLNRSKAAMDTLGRRGLSGDVIRLMGLDDPKNFQQAERFVADLAKNPKLVQQWNKAIKDRLKISEGIATDPNNSKFAEMKRSFDITAKLAAQAFQRSLGDFEDAYERAQKREVESLNNLAKDAMTGMTDIMGEAKKTGIQNIKAFADAILKQVGVASGAIAGLVNQGVAAAGAGGQGYTPGSGNFNASISGSVKGGGYGDVGVTTKTFSGPEHSTVTKTNSYVAPGTGTVYKGGQSTGLGKGGVNTGKENFQPSADFMAQHPPQVNYNKSIAKSMAPMWSKGEQWAALEALWAGESGWNQYADNPGSSAYGIPQALPGFKMKDAGADWRTNPATQIKWGLQYIAGKYGTPREANAFKKKMGWYGDGAIFKGRSVIGVGERGPEMVLPLNTSGGSFLAAVVAQSLQRSGISPTAARGTRTAGYAGVTISGPVTYSSDYSTAVTGPITVMSNDPNDMMRKLEQRKRMAALTRPVGGRS